MDVIKLYPLTLEQYQAVIAVARKHGKRVHAHISNPQTMRDAMRAGVDVLTHVGTRPPYDDDLMREIVETGQAVSPTAALRFAIYPATVDFPERLQDPRLKQDFPPEIYEEVQNSFQNFHALGYFQNMDRIMDFGPAVVRKWVQSGALIGMGTDSGTPMNFHTEALWREMKLFVDYGMSPQRAIASATRINARSSAAGATSARSSQASWRTSLSSMATRCSTSPRSDMWRSSSRTAWWSRAQTRRRPAAGPRGDW